MTRVVALGGVLALLILDGVFSGVVTGRWTDNSPPVNFDMVLPDRIGDFVRVDATKLTDRQLAAAQINRSLEAVYRCASSPGAISVFVAGGPSGPLSVHTPDICYPGTGFELESPIVGKTAVLGDKNFEYRKGVFSRKSADGVNRILVLWTWNADGMWTAPENPRWLASKPSLAKLYMVHSNFDSEAAAEDNCLRLMRSLNKLLLEK